mmetsp:Transcript_25792/g.55164  ORF Transcript_25792/g.55164 Transcript_25792/m.55164 type:complete len:240 (-) Transcript_25792:76-795(-)
MGVADPVVEVRILRPGDPAVAVLCVKCLEFLVPTAPLFVVILTVVFDTYVHRILYVAAKTNSNVKTAAMVVARGNNGSGGKNIFRNGHPVGSRGGDFFRIPILCGRCWRSFSLFRRLFVVIGWRNRRKRCTSVRGCFLRGWNFHWRITGVVVVAVVFGFVFVDPTPSLSHYYSSLPRLSFVLLFLVSLCPLLLDVFVFVFVFIERVTVTGSNTTVPLLYPGIVLAGSILLGLAFVATNQ